MPIKLKINLPNCSLPEENFAKVILPISKGTLTVIEDRAPTMLLLEAGVVALADDENHIHKRWFINGGIADIAENKCTLAVEEAVNLSDVSLADLAEKAKQHVFYRQIYEYMQIFG